MPLNKLSSFSSIKFDIDIDKNNYVADLSDLTKGNAKGQRCRRFC